MVVTVVTFMKTDTKVSEVARKQTGVHPNRWVPIRMLPPLWGSSAVVRLRTARRPNCDRAKYLPKSVKSLSGLSDLPK
jgi:hypothetical protein